MLLLLMYYYDDDVLHHHACCLTKYTGQVSALWSLQSKKKRQLRKEDAEEGIEAWGQQGTNMQ